MNAPRFRSCAFVIVATALSGPSALADLPVSGKPVPELASFDAAMQSFMAQNNIASGVLAVSRNGCIVYQRGFGYLQFVPTTITLPENTPMRIASCEKPITSAAIRELINDNLLEWTDFVFDLGQPGVGILPITPWNGIGDSRLDDVEIQDVFDHRGGWDRDTAVIGDPQFRAIVIANTMGIASPPGRDNTIRFMLSQPLQFTPGTNGCTDGNGNPTICYSNFGYMCLGRVIEEVSGTSYINYVRGNILTPNMWVPSTEIFTGRTFDAQQSPREPIYDFPSNCTNVFNPNGPTVWCPYGGWEHEVFIGHGNLVMSAAPMLVYMDRYQVDVGGAAGTRLTNPADAFPFAHSGAVDGTGTVLWQRGDGINIVVLFNKREDAPLAASHIGDIIDAGGFTWPTDCVDGAWVDFNAPAGFEVGGYNHPYRSMTSVAASTTNGTKLRIKPGTTTWTGTINKKLLIDAPLGTARIGG